MTREPDAASLAGAILAGANRTFLVPAVLAQVLQAGPDAVRLFGLLKTYTYGAAPMPLPLLRAAMRGLAGHRLHPGLRAHRGGRRGHPPDARRAPRRAPTPSAWSRPGSRSPACEVRIVDPATLVDLPAGEHGEIWLRTPQLMKGFLGKPEETAKVITADGWFRTGDMGRVDDEGFVFVEDRLKDMIISGGENIYSPEIERVLAEHPAVMEVAIIGVPDDRWGETVKAVVSLKPDTSRPRPSCRLVPAVARVVQVPDVGGHPRRCCPATRPARSSSASCGGPTGRAGTPRSCEPSMSAATSYPLVVGTTSV